MSRLAPTEISADTDVMFGTDWGIGWQRCHFWHWLGYRRAPMSRLAPTESSDGAIVHQAANLFHNIKFLLYAQLQRKWWVLTHSKTTTRKHNLLFCRLLWTVKPIKTNLRNVVSAEASAVQVALKATHRLRTHGLSWADVKSSVLCDGVALCFLWNSGWGFKWYLDEYRALKGWIQLTARLQCAEHIR
jgi:hypothetical protein